MFRGQIERPGGGMRSTRLLVVAGVVAVVGALPVQVARAASGTQVVSGTVTYSADGTPVVNGVVWSPDDPTGVTTHTDAAGNYSLTLSAGVHEVRTSTAGCTDPGDATVMIDTTTGRLGIVTSSARYKEDIAPMAASSEGVFQLHPVTFAYKNDARHVTHYGLVAEEVAAVYPDLVTHTATGEVQTVKYQELIPMLLNELQRLRQELSELRAQRGRSAEGVPTLSAK